VQSQRYSERITRNQQVASVTHAVEFLGLVIQAGLHAHQLLLDPEHRKKVDKWASTQGLPALQKGTTQCAILSNEVLYLDYGPAECNVSAVWELTLNRPVLTVENGY